MTLYHGTCAIFRESIMRLGLVPPTDERDGNRRLDRRGVFLTTSRDVAIFRATERTFGVRCDRLRDELLAFDATFGEGAVAPGRLRIERQREVQDNLVATVRGLVIGVEPPADAFGQFIGPTVDLVAAGKVGDEPHALYSPGVVPVEWFTNLWGVGEPEGLNCEGRPATWDLVPRIEDWVTA